MMRFVLIRRSVVTIFIVMGLIAIVGLVAFSPFALAGISHSRDDWPQLSNIGQTYGAVSAVLSALALGGILVSLLYQARDSRTSHEQITRTFQFELIKLELEDPALMAAMGAPWGLDIPSDSASLRQFLYVQMWVSHLAGRYAIGQVSASTVRQLAALEIFRGRAGRIYWEAVGQRQIANSDGRYNVFYRLIDDEYDKAIADGIPVVSPIADAIPMPPVIAAGIRSDQLDRAGSIIIAAFIGILAGRLWRRRIILNSVCGPTGAEARGKPWVERGPHKCIMIQ